MKLPVFKTASVLSAILIATTACAQPDATKPANNNTAQSSQSTKAAGTVSADIDSHLRQVLTQAGIKTQITSITPSNLPNMYQVELVGQPPLHMTADGKYVIQAELIKNPNPNRLSSKTPTSIDSAQIGKPFNTNAKTPFYYTAVPGVIWGANLEGVPFLVSDDGQYITDGEISVIENGQFMGLDEEFEKRKNQSVFSVLDESQLITYPATTAEKAVIYVATDVNCPFCRQLHKQMDALNKKGVTVKTIGYPIYEQSPEQMRGIWCQADESSRRKALDNAMLKGQMTPAPAGCSADHITPNRDKAAGLAVMATPAIYREDGVLFQASFESPEFLEFLGVE